MLCTKCNEPIKKGEKYYRTKKGPHHDICPIIMSKYCDCKKWKINWPILSPTFVFNDIYYNDYEKEMFQFCPWCGKKLSMVAT